MIRTQMIISRRDVRANPNTLYVFGDNMKGYGYGGQAAVMRGAPNAVGIPTKWEPAMHDDAFFADADWPFIADLVLDRFKRLVDHLAKGGDVVWPQDGVGTGRAKLRSRAPLIWGRIEGLREKLFAIHGDPSDARRASS